MDTNQLTENRYLDKMNPAPYGAIVVSLLILLGLLTTVVLMGIF